MKVEELLFGELCDIPAGYLGDYLYYAKEHYKDITVEDFQYISSKKRETFRDEYKNLNKIYINELNKVLEDNEIKYNFVSKYAPNIEVELSKKEILKVAKLTTVDEIYLVDTYSNIYTSKNMEQNLTIDDELVLDHTYFNVTGLSTARDAFGLTGAGMKVGVIEWEDKLFTEKFDNENITILQQGNAEDDCHSSQVCGLMISNRTDFVGAIPESHLYYSANGNNTKSSIEEMMDYGVNAINCSFSSYIASNLYNTYTDDAKWYDHIATQHNLHIILSSGNEGSSGVPINMSYNAIVVGNCDQSGSIANDSSHVNIDESSYKPDIVAPGFNLAMPFYTYGYGTSVSAPLVTSAVIQLCQASPILASNPTLMKALLLSSSNITNGMQNEPVFSTTNSGTIALSKKYGAGRLNVSKAYESFVTKGNYISSTFSSNSTGAIFNRNITKVANKTIRFCLTWDKYNTINGEHNSNSINSSPLDNLRLTVVTPSGTIYSSNYMYDNKQMITFSATENGYYSIRVYREGSSNSSNSVDYSISYSIY